jgi:hypothetical protein
MTEPVVENIVPIKDDAHLNAILEQNKITTPAEVKKDVKQEPVKDGKTADITPLTTAKKEEAKPEVTPTAEKPAEQTEKPLVPKQKLRDKIKGDFLSKPDVTKSTPSTPTRTVEEIQKEYEALKAELDDPAVQIVREAKKNGKNIFQVLEEVKGINPDSMSAEQLYEYELRRNGIKPENEVTDPEAPTIEGEMAKFKEMSFVARNREIQSIKNQLKGDAELRQKDFLTKIRHVDPQAAKEQENLSNSFKNYGDLVDSALDQEIYTIKITPDVQKRLKDVFIQNKLIPKTAEGLLDHRAMLELAILSEFKDMIIDNIESANYAQGVEFIANEVEATPASETQNSRPPEIQTRLREGTEEYAKEISQNLRPLN